LFCALAQRDDGRVAGVVDALAEHGKEGRQERDGGDDHDRHTDRHGDSKTADEREPDGHETEQGDDDRDAGEDDRAARRVDGLDHGVLHGETVMERLAEARDDEQRVVDADAETDHRHHGGGLVRHGHQVAHHGHDPGGDQETEEGDADGQAHRDDRPERDDEDDDRREEAERLALGELELLERHPAVGNRGHCGTQASGGFLDRVAHLDHRVALAPRRVDLDERDRAVAADLVRELVRPLHAHTGELREVRDGIGQRSLHRGVVDALVGLHNDLGGDAALAWAHLREHLLGDCRLAVGLAELGAEVVADGAARKRDDHREREPDAEHHEPAVTDGERCQATEHQERLRVRA